MVPLFSAIATVALTEVIYQIIASSIFKTSVMLAYPGNVICFSY